jgi:bifunctional non-homologous end joining protein LigD
MSKPAKSTAETAEGGQLSRYQSMRDFAETPEPAGALGPPPPEAPAGQERFVVHEHHATSLHWDLRLERDGVLASWAVPKGVPPDPRTNHLAVRTEDHPIEYLSFHGEIPGGNYGAGQMTIWDTGTYEPLKWEGREVVATFHGKRMSGRYALFRTRGNQWMIHRMDPPADPDRQSFPGLDAFAPMEAAPGRMPAARQRSAFSFEIAWEGRRVFVHIEGGRVRVRDVETGSDITGLIPEVRALGGTVGTTEMLLDGEIIVPGEGGRPDAERLARRLAARSDSVARRLSRSEAAVVMLSDLLWREGHATTDLAYAERRRLLGDLHLEGPAWQVPPVRPADEGPALLKAVSAQGLPGLVAKRLNSPYRPGPAQGDWILIAAERGGGARASG